MKRSTFIKGLTLLSFIFFLTAFVLYRMGKFDSYLSTERSSFQTSPNGGNIGQEPTDTVPRSANDSSGRLLLSSSKSMILIDSKLSFRDSIKQKRTLDSVINAINKRPKTIMMSSSKSGPVFIPQLTITFPQLDSVKPLHKLDTLKKH